MTVATSASLPHSLCFPLPQTCHVKVQMLESSIHKLTFQDCPISHEGQPISVKAFPQLINSTDLANTE
jgi:hypothetical protein